MSEPEPSATVEPVEPSVEPAARTPLLYVCSGKLFDNKLRFEISKILSIAECRCENEMKHRSAFRCQECGHRIMYKKRTKGLNVFDAR